MQITYSPIGIIHSPFTQLSGMPIQPTSESSAEGKIEIYPKFSNGLKSLEGFSHIYLLYHLHKAAPAKLRLKPFLDDEIHGVFATRAPRRPNPIGLSLVNITRVDENFIFVENIDVLNGTPLLDLKPYIPEFEDANEIRVGWVEKSKGKVRQKKSDERFLDE